MNRSENDMVERVALLPCPFCGGEARPATVKAGGTQWAQVECLERGCVAAGPTHATEAEAIAAWNTRPALAAMSEPTSAMVRAGIAAAAKHVTLVKIAMVDDIWAAMARVAAQEGNSEDV